MGFANSVDQKRNKDFFSRCSRIERHAHQQALQSCVDMNANQDGDSEELQNVRAIIGDLIHKWVQEEHV